MRLFTGFNVFLVFLLLTSLPSSFFSSFFFLSSFSFSTSFFSSSLLSSSQTSLYRDCRHRLSTSLLLTSTIDIITIDHHKLHPRSHHDRIVTRILTRVTDQQFIMAKFDFSLFPSSSSLLFLSTSSTSSSNHLFLSTSTSTFTNDQPRNRLLPTILSKWIPIWRCRFRLSSLALLVSLV